MSVAIMEALGLIGFTGKMHKKSYISDVAGHWFATLPKLIISATTLALVKTISMVSL